MTHLQKTAATNTVALTFAAAPFAIRAERGSDVAAREQLLDMCFGPSRLTRTCQRLRDGRAPAEGLAFTAVSQGPGDLPRVVGTVRLWHVDAGGRAALMLGPLAVDPSCQALGIGGALMRHAIAAARKLGHGAIILLGDAPYYARFGFTPVGTADLALPGPFERDRLLALELREGALTGAAGVITATGKALPDRHPARMRRAA